MGVLKLNELTPNTWYIYLERWVENQIPIHKTKLKFLGCIDDEEQMNDPNQNYDIYIFRRENNEVVEISASINHMKQYNLDGFEYFYLPGDPGLAEFSHIPINNDYDIDKIEFAFPTVRDATPKSSFMNGKGDVTCPICADQLSNIDNGPCVIVNNGEGQNPVRCGHKYHLDCITMHCIHSYNKATASQTPVQCLCPICKGNIVDLDIATQIGGMLKNKTKKRKTLKKTRKE